MIRAVSSYMHVRERLHPGTLDLYARGGAQAIELFCARGHFNYHEREHVRELAVWFRSHPVTPHSLHSPMFSDDDWGRRGGIAVDLAHPEKRLRIAAMDEVKRAIEVAETLPYRFLIQHLGNPGDVSTSSNFEAALTAVEHLRAFAKPLGVMLLLENIPNQIARPENLLELVRAGHFEDVGFCFDFGHAHLAGSVAADFSAMRERIRSTHVHDNAGDRDAHLWPGQGTIAWKEAMELLASAPHVPPLLLEIDGREGEDPGAAIAEAFRRLMPAVAAGSS